ncbi:NADP oxidoreductase coenzyme F420-dependent [Pseudonocardia dioxanivorans CB1190]|uniref:NADP oxidoreductase coenzyme F420-dependent n=1 Tax=Pseudonocardia dioxanivorans (strain ATCC 55486 / DSM 44775 / JCM 13855 / CB1190) TaxID=675635 RepID=F4CSY6_PSEUX|nr:NADPH-dependent F420 reductase [Pseudonocardia dioxanivorans]AEA25285.1 NADP oxidoreductase coenzyme F420-dependent [Pseudonocardia dioxanivorans CB1190]
MTIGIVGTGNMGKAIAGLFADGGHDVYIAGSDPEKSEAAAQELASRGPGKVSAVPTAEAAARGTDVLVLATWFAVSTRLAVDLSDVLRGKTVIDISNPFTPNFDGLITEYGNSAGLELQRRLDGSAVVKAFNTNFAPTLRTRSFGGSDVDVFLASDHESAKADVAKLIGASGLRPVDAGPLANSATLERLTLLLVELQGRYGLEFQSAVKFLPGQSLSFPAAVATS